MSKLSGKSFYPKKIEKSWYCIDASGKTVGRLAVVIAKYLKGKYKATFTPAADCGDNVIVINCDKVVFTGKKFQTKKYYRHTGYPGGIKFSTPSTLFRSGKPEDILKNAVDGMLSSGPLARERMRNLYLYQGNEHPHVAQSPVLLNVDNLVN